MNLFRHLAALFLVSTLVNWSEAFECYDYVGNSQIPNATYVVVRTLEGAKYCLSLCSHSRFIFSFDCKSVMVNHVKRECYLSEFTRHQKPIIYAPGTEYYEKTCNPLESSSRTIASIQSPTPRRYNSLSQYDFRYRQYTTQRYTTTRYTTRYSTRRYTTTPYTTPRPTTRRYTTQRYTTTRRTPAPYTRPTTPRYVPPRITTQTPRTTLTTLPPIPIPKMSLEELENMENGSSEEYEEDDYPEKRYAKRSAQASETVNSSIVLNNRGERRIRPTPVTVQDDVAEAPLAKPLRVPILRTHSNVAKVIKLVETDRDDSSTMPSLQVENNPAKVEENLIQGCFTQKINRRLMNFEEKSVTSNTIDGCTTQCINENSFLCLSANYDTETKKCILNGGSASINEVMIIEMPNFIYLENKCVAKNENSKVVDVSTVIKHLPKLRQCFRIRENAVLFELQGTVVESAKTLSDCLLVCGQSRKLYRTACISVNWFKLTNQCYIHSATSHTSQLQNSDATDFYKNICFESDFVADDEPVRTIDTLYDDNNTA